MHSTVVIHSLRVLVMRSIRFFSHLKYNTITATGIRQALSAIGPSDLLITDIDDTLVTSLGRRDQPRVPGVCGDGSEMWVKSQFDQLCQSHSKKVAFDKTIKLFESIQKEVVLTPVENDTVDEIKRIQNQGSTVMGLTTRSPSLASITHQQLNELNLHFGSTNNDAIPLIDLPASPHNITLYQGVLFCGRVDKGQAFLNFLNTIMGQRAIKNKTGVYFIDNSLRHVQAFNAIRDQLPGLSLTTVHYPFVQLHYHLHSESDEEMISNNNYRAA